MDYNKLVRDRIPAAIAATGRQPQVRQLAPEEFRAALRAKLLEEAAECAMATTREQIAEECADLLEVIAAVAELEGIDWGEIVALRERKAEERGAFRNMVLLISAD